MEASVDDPVVSCNVDIPPVISCPVVMPVSDRSCDVEAATLGPDELPLVVLTSPDVVDGRDAVELDGEGSNASETPKVFRPHPDRIRPAKKIARVVRLMVHDAAETADFDQYIALSAL